VRGGLGAAREARGSPAPDSGLGAGAAPSHRARHRTKAPAPPLPPHSCAGRRGGSPGAAAGAGRLSSGKLQDLGVVEGSKLTLVPTVEAGLMSQASRPEQSVMQALESLTETQVNDFLSGRSPLTLALRVGDHMMFVQLQLAAQQSTGQLQHRHLIASRGEAGASSSPHCRTLHGPRLPAPAPPVYCNAPHAAPVTAGMFRSRAGAGLCAEADPCFSPRRWTVAPAAAAPAAAVRPPRPDPATGAVIESFRSTTRWGLSGTFSGTLHPNCQGQQRILNDLLSATRHYRACPVPDALRCQTQFSSSSSSSSSSSLRRLPPRHSATNTPQSRCRGHRPTLHPLSMQSQIRMCKPSGEGPLRQTENRATRCKVESCSCCCSRSGCGEGAQGRQGSVPLGPNRKAGRDQQQQQRLQRGSLDLDSRDSVWKPGGQGEMNPVCRR
uniref:Midnolin n=1 Tax=Malurus cyaneus samueli TaxID=2593467 RepID=A0A8C5UIC1_9PASS